MYISIKLPSSFGAFNQLRKENYPFNNLFTSYLAAVCRLGLSLKMDVEQLIGFIEDQVFDGQRLPDIPEGNEPVNIRYKTDDPDVIKYISSSKNTNKNVVMYIARMTLRLSAAYGTSLFRLTRVITGLDPEMEPKKAPRTPKDQTRAAQPVPAPRPKAKQEATFMEQPAEEPETEPVNPEPKEEPMHMPRISNRSAERPAPVQEQRPSAINTSVEAAKAAIGGLSELLEQAQGEDIVETNPALKDFL